MSKKDNERRYENPQVRNSGIMVYKDMRKNNIMVPKPRSNFLSVQCMECREKRIVFSHSTTDINCKSCGQLIVQKAGSKAKILAEVLNILDQT